MPIELRAHQVPAVEAVLAAHARGLRRPLLALPTGSGKTVIMAHLATRVATPVLFLVHRDELVTQLVETLQSVIPAEQIGQVYRRRNELDRPYLVASVQTLARPARLRPLPTIQTIFVDEAHHAPASTYQRILTHCGVFEPHGPFLLGVTATPERLDGRPLMPTFEEIVYHQTLTAYLKSGSRRTSPGSATARAIFRTRR